MTTGIFNQKIETQAAQQQALNPVTAGGLGDAIKAATPLITKGAEIGIAFNQKSKLEEEFGEVSEELSGLDKTFDSIKQASASGANKGALQSRARAALKSAVAVSPSLQGHAEQLYSNYFGGGGTSGKGTSGAFSLSAEEEQAQALQGQMVNYQLQGFSEDQAFSFVRAETLGAQSKLAAETLANQAKVAAYEAKPVAENMLLAEETKFQVGIQTVMNENGGAIPQGDKVNLSRQMDASLLQQKQAILRSVTDPSTGSLTVSPEAYRGMVDEATKRISSMKQLLDDNSALKLIQDSNQFMNETTTAALYKSMPGVMALNKIGQGELAITMLRDSKQGEFIRQSYPQLAEILEGKVGEQGKINVDSAAKLFGLSDEPISSNEAIVAGGSLATNSQLAMKAYEYPDSGSAQFYEIGKFNPGSLAATFTPQTKSIRESKAGSMKAKVQAQQNGVMSSFTTSFRDTFGYFPTGIEVVVADVDPASILSSSRPYANIQKALNTNKISVNTAGGETLTQPMVNMIADLYRSVKANPKMLPDKLQGFAPEQAVAVWINSGMNIENIPEPMLTQFKAEQEDAFSYTTREEGQPSKEVETTTPPKPRAASAAPDISEEENAEIDKAISELSDKEWKATKEAALKKKKPKVWDWQPLQEGVEISDGEYGTEDSMLIEVRDGMVRQVAGKNFPDIRISGEPNGV